MGKVRRSRGDEAWKALLQVYFGDFLDFFFPDLGRELERGRYDFLDGELQSLSRRIRTGKRIADRLVRVFLRQGGETWLLVHLEIQGKAEAWFEERLFIYSYRIYDRYRMDVVTLAVLTDDEKGFRPCRFEMGRFGSRHCFEFPSVKLYDYRDRVEELEKSTNPFAVVVLAYLRLHQTKMRRRERLEWKIALATGLDEKGFTEDTRNDLLNFIDWLLALPEPLEIEFGDAMKKHEEEKNMAYVTSFERIALKKGRAEGREEGREEKAVEMAVMMIRDGYQRAVVLRLTGITGEQYEALAESERRQE
jgi:hypothetical protein